MAESTRFSSIVAYVRAEKKLQVQNALKKSQQGGFSSWDVTGMGESQGRLYEERHLRYEAVVPSEEADHVARAIMQAASNGKVGDGFVFVSPVSSVYRIRTKELL